MPPHQYFYRDTSLEGLSTKAKEDPSLHEMTLSPTGHQPRISWSQGSTIIIIVIIIVIIISIIIIIIIIMIINIFVDFF